MQGGHAVDRVRADDGEVGHAEGFGAVLVDEGEHSFLVIVAGPLRLDRLHEAPIDLENDLSVARQHLVEERQTPLFQRLGEKRVVGVAEGAGDDSPGVGPVELLLVHEDALKLGDGHGRVGVVELDGNLVGEVVPGIS